MYIAIKKTEVFLSFINVNLHVVQLMTVTSLHVTAHNALSVTISAMLLVCHLPQGKRHWL